MGQHGLHDALLPFDFSFQPRHFAQAGLLLQLLLFHVGGIVARSLANKPVRQLYDAVDRAVEEGPVVRNHQYRTPEMGDILLKPLQRSHVQMVGGFVQEQKIRFQQQQARQTDTHALASGQGRQRTLEHVPGQSQSVQGEFHIALVIVATPCFKTGGRRRIGLHQPTVFHRIVSGGREGVLQMAQLGLQPLQFAVGQGRLIRIPGFVDILGEITGQDPGGADHRSHIWRLQPFRDPEQGGFAASVGSDQSDSGSGVKAEGDTLQDRPVKIGLFDLLKGHDHASWTHPFRRMGACRGPVRAIPAVPEPPETTL